MMRTRTALTSLQGASQHPVSYASETKHTEQAHMLAGMSGTPWKGQRPSLVPAHVLRYLLRLSPVRVKWNSFAVPVNGSGKSSRANCRINKCTRVALKCDGHVFVKQASFG